MNKKFIKIPEDIIDKILLSAKLTESFSGKTVNREEIMKTIEKENIKLTDEQLERIDEAYPVTDAAPDC